MRRVILRPFGTRVRRFHGKTTFRRTNDALRNAHAIIRGCLFLPAPLELFSLRAVENDFKIDSQFVEARSVYFKIGPINMNPKTLLSRLIKFDL